MQTRLTASIVINTYNRARSLERLLPSLDHLVGVHFEVVVVNGPSTDDTELVLERYRGRVKVAHCPTANLSRSRNIGIAAAAGDVVVFIDDDAVPSTRTWLSRLVDAFEREGADQVGAAGGASLHRDTEWPEFAGGWTSDFGEQLFTDQPLPPNEDPRRWCRRTVGNNSAFRRTALERIGGFDERFRYYLDEADVCLRLVRTGYDVVYLEDCAVRHYPATSPLGQPFIRDRRLIGRSDTYYCLKNGSAAWPRRILETCRRAPRKHFVRELRDLAAEGRISIGQLWRLRSEWVRGVVEGLALGLFGPRKTGLPPGEPEPLVTFRRHRAANRLSVCLLARRIPPDPHAGGVGRYTYDLARGLHERGHRVTLITEAATPVRHEGLEFQILGVQPGAPPAMLRQTPALAQNLGYADAVTACFGESVDRDGPFDVVHASNWGLDALGVARLDTCPLVLMLVTPLEKVIEAEGWEATLDLASNLHLDQWLVGRATRVCAPSSGVRSSYLARAGWDGRSLQRVPLGIVPKSDHSRDRSRQHRLLFVGRLERRKGIHVLLDVLPGLLQRHPHWRCDIVGDTSPEAQPGDTFASLFRKRHAGARWMNRVTIHGPVADDDLHRLYRHADVFVAPSLFESFGLIYLEAMQYGVPVVGCRVGGVPEVVSDEMCGLLVPPDDAQALDAALARLLSNAGLRRRLGTRAREAFKARGSHLAFAERMEVEYRAAIETHPSRVDTVVETALDGTAQPVTEFALQILDSSAAPKGLGLAVRAAAALEQGAHDEASTLVTAALGVSTHPEYYALAVDLALSDGDLPRAVAYAERGFAATRDGSDMCFLFAATLVISDEVDMDDVVGWAQWWHTHRRIWPPRLLGAAVAAIRVGHDYSAVVLLRAALADSPRDRTVMAQVLYHLGSAYKRQGNFVAARESLERVVNGGYVASLPSPVRAALHFHLGDLNLDEHRLAAAIREFESCLALNPSHQRARSLLAEAIDDNQAAA